MTTEGERAVACRQRATALKRLADTLENASMREEIIKLAQEWGLSAERAERRARRKAACKTGAIESAGGELHRSFRSDSFALMRALGRRHQS